MEFNVRAAVRIALVLFLIALSCCLSHLIGSLELSQAILSKMSLSIGARALSVFFLKMGCSGGLASAIVIVLRMALLATEGNQMMPSGEGGRSFRWTDLFGSSATDGNSEASVNQAAANPGNSEASVNQAAANPGDPEARLDIPLLDEGQRRQELSDRLGINSIGKPVSDAEREAILGVQLKTELKIERALRSDGFSEDSLISQRHRIRGIIFYPNGKPLTLDTYTKHLNDMYSYGTHRTLCYKRIRQALSKVELELERVDI